MSEQSENERLSMEFRADVKSTLIRIEERLRKLEDSHNKQEGGIKVLLLVCAGISSFVGFVASMIFKHSQ